MVDGHRWMIYFLLMVFFVFEGCGCLCFPFELLKDVFFLFFGWWLWGLMVGLFSTVLVEDALGSYGIHEDLDVGG